MRIAVTGTSGFVGSRLIGLDTMGHELVPLDLRRSIPKETDLRGIDAIIHLAGLAHQMKPVPAERYDEVNFRLTRELADRALMDGVRHFIYVSSTKVYGEESEGHFDEHSTCKPVDPYGASKRKAEEYLMAKDTDEFRVAIVRPPLVYGPGVKGNMIRLMQMADRKIPLPLGGIQNARSMVFVDNLIALFYTILEKGAKGIFIAGDQGPVSTTNLVCIIRAALNNRFSLVPIPDFVRGWIRRLKPALYIRLFGSFVVDNKGTNLRLGFQPPYSTEQGVGVMADWYVKTNQHHG
jgi:nucleoside-diphosphate-sugar epimerase